MGICVNSQPNWSEQTNLFFFLRRLSFSRVHDNSSKDTLSNTTISLQRQLVYYDSLSNATLSLLFFLPTTFGPKKLKHNLQFNALRVYCDVSYVAVVLESLVFRDIHIEKTDSIQKLGNIKAAL